MSFDLNHGPAEVGISGARNPSCASVDRGLLYAEACFETVRVWHGEIFRWPEHDARLHAGLAQFGLPCPGELLPRCLLAASKVGDDVLLRLTVSGGFSERALMPLQEREVRVHVQAWPYRQAEIPLALRTLEWSGGGMARSAKFTADYAATIRQLHHARTNGLLGEDEQALFIRAGELMATETANILLNVDGRWLTPDSDVVLPGVVRSSLIEAGCVDLANCTLDLLDRCKAMAICNSGCFVRPVSLINGRRLSADSCLFEILLQGLQGQPGVPEPFCL